jgi:hypothetical protein
VATVRKQQAHLITRIRPQTFPFELHDGQTLDIVAQLRFSGPSVREWAGWCTAVDGERYAVRLLAAKLPAHEVRARLTTLAHDAGWVLSSWGLTTLSVDVLRQQVCGGWGSQRVQACLPRLQRFLTSRVRQDRTHQETTVRAWLERRPRYATEQGLALPDAFFEGEDSLS